MDRTIETKSKSVEPGLWRPGKARLLSYQNVGVSLYDNGTMVATHARLDGGSNRMVFTRLSDQETLPECPHYMAWALAQAAEEVLADAHEAEPHL